MLFWLKEKFELSRGGSKHNLRPMEGLRGFAVLLVFLVHYSTLIQPWLAQQSSTFVIAKALHRIGNSGVDLFFVLSGYLIYGTLLSRYHPFVPFMARRIERIYPAFTAVFLIYVALSFVFPAESKIPAPVGAGVLYLLENYLLLPGLLPIQPMITVAWSLSYEMFYYLAIPLVVALFKLRDRSPSWRVTFFIVVAAVFASYTAVSRGPVHLLMFISGILLYEAVRHSQWRVPDWAALTALVIGVLSPIAPIPSQAAETIKVTILFVTFFVLCLACFRAPAGSRRHRLSAAFTWTPLRWLGNMSYSYYLIHGLTLQAAFLCLSLLLPPTGGTSALFWALLPPMFVVTLGPSALLFLLIERPFSLAEREPRPAPKLPQAASASESGS